MLVTLTLILQINAQYYITKNLNQFDSACSLV